MPAPTWTPYADLNSILRELVEGARYALGENLCAAYLQGSFAVGDADEHSDVDFVVVTEVELTPADRAALQELHGRLHERDVEWAQHLEGSYASKQRLRRVDPTRAPLFYLDNGARKLIWDPHCNTAIVRWSLRERGVVLAGPPPGELIDPVTPDELRADARRAMHEAAAWARESRDRFGRGEPLAFSRWKQPYLVLSFCRFLHTLESGTVSSKLQAGEWARAALGERWRALIQRALDDRPDPWRRVHEPAGPPAVEETIAFVEYARGRAGLCRPSS